MAMNQPPAPRSSNKVLNRAFALGAALVTGVVAVTGVFVAKIADSYAAGHTSTSVTNQDSDSGDGTDGGQVSVPQQNQAPLGGSNGS